MKEKLKRNYINEITSVKSRSEYTTLYDFSRKLEDIESAFNKSLNDDENLAGELIKYIPIATVACFEAFFRSVYKELIDSGKPFRDNVTKLDKAKIEKFDFNIVDAIQTKTFTIGEFISHQLTCNSFADISHNLTALTGSDFPKQIKMFKNKRENSNKFIKNSDQIIGDIERIFELRHIFCHEFATNLKVDKDKIWSYFTSAKVFLEHTNDFIWNKLYPDAPKTEAEMPAHATKEFEATESKLSELIETIKKACKKDFPLNSRGFNTTIAEWKKYRETKANFDASPYKSWQGVMHYLIYIGSKRITTEEKIESLKKEYESYLKNYAEGL